MLIIVVCTLSFKRCHNNIYCVIISTEQTGIMKYTVTDVVNKEFGTYIRNSDFGVTESINNFHVDSKTNLRWSGCLKRV